MNDEARRVQTVVESEVPVLGVDGKQDTSHTHVHRRTVDKDEILNNPIRQVKHTEVSGYSDTQPGIIKNTVTTFLKCPPKIFRPRYLNPLYFCEVLIYLLKQLDP